jgi:hypothetical protein
MAEASPERLTRIRAQRLRLDYAIADLQGHRCKCGRYCSLNSWPEALGLGGRLLFPLTPDQGYGAMLLVRRTSTDEFDARFLCRAMFVPCVGARDDAIPQRLSDVFASKDPGVVRSLRRNNAPDETCWFHGGDWWLSTAPIGARE